MILILFLFVELSTSSKAQLSVSKVKPSAIDSTSQSISNKTDALSDSLNRRVSKIKNFPDRYIGQVGSKTRQLNSRITRRTARALRRLQRQEEKIRRGLTGIDSVAVNNLLTKSIDSLGDLRDIIRGKVTRITEQVPASQYIPYLDTLKNSLKFLDKYQNKFKDIETFSKVKQMSGKWKKIQGSLNQVRQLEGRLNQIQNIQQYIDQQQQMLTQSLSAYRDILKNNLGKFGREVYYYKEQIKNYKELWEQPDKLERKALSLLHEVPAFADFMKEHSALASLFNIAEGASVDPEESLQGLQTRVMVQQELQQQIQADGMDGGSRLQQQMSKARQKLKELKDKLSGGSSTASMPEFKPKNIKSHTFLQRLEFGGNVQFSKPSRFASFSGVTFPTTSDIAGQVAYKFSEKGSIGIGAAFKLGWGSFDSAQEPSFGSMSTPLNASPQEPAFGPGSVDNFIGKIHFTARGVGLRSFINYKIRGSIYLNGGIEMNYNKTIPRIPELKGLNGWTSSALLGIEKKYRISDKLKGDMMLLFDFLYKRHIPRTQPMVFRVGYNF